MHAKLVASLLVARRAVVAEGNASASSTRVDETLAGSIARLTLREATRMFHRECLSPDARRVAEALSALGSSFRAAHAHQVAMRYLAWRDQHEQHDEETNTSKARRGDGSGRRASVDSRSGGPGGAEYSPDADSASRRRSMVDVESSLTAERLARSLVENSETATATVDAATAKMAYDAAERADRVSDAVAELISKGVLTADWASLDDALGAANRAHALGDAEFVSAEEPFPVEKPEGVRRWAKRFARHRRDAEMKELNGGLGGGSGEGEGSGEGSGEGDRGPRAASSNLSDSARRPERGEGYPDSDSAASDDDARGRLGRVARLQFANASTRAFTYEALPSHVRRALHLEACRDLQAECAASRWSGAAGGSFASLDPTTHATALERAADHLRAVQAVDRAAMAAHINRSDRSRGEAFIGAISTAPIRVLGHGQISASVESSHAGVVGGTWGNADIVPAKSSPASAGWRRASSATSAPPTRTSGAAPSRPP